MSMLPQDELQRLQMEPQAQEGPYLTTPSSYDEGYRLAELEERESMQPSEREAAANIDGLGLTLMEEFHEAEQAREFVNERWLEDLRQYRGVYDSEIYDRLKENGTSRAFYRLTTSKVNTMTARLVDLMFPQKTKNWEIEATPAPDLPQDVLLQDMAEEFQSLTMQIAETKQQELVAQGIMPTPDMAMMLMQQCQQEAMEQIDTPENRVRVAKARAKKMEDVIDDQLKECRINGQTRPGWRQNCRRVIKSACTYGMGILKGPLIEQVSYKRYQSVRQPDGAVVWQEQETEQEYRPYQEAVSVWEIYPDPGARIPAELRYVWQRHCMTDKEVKELINVPGFDAEKIMSYMKAHEDGDAEMPQWMTQVRELNADNSSGSNMALKHRYMLYERWGYLSGKDLRSAGVDIPEDQDLEIYPSCVWILGDTVIKAAVNPLEGVDIPYHFYPFQEDDSSFWPEGICYALRTPQACINAAIRAMQDNANLSSGPIFGINVSALAPGNEDVLRDMRAGKMFVFDQPGKSLSEAFQAVTVPSSIEHNLQQVQFWSNVADEVSTPRFNQGDGSIKGAGETASGLSMLMGASNILLKDHVKDFDDCIVTPFIRAMFRWNMQWNPDESIKGDYEVVASGSQSLIAKEVRAQQVPALITYLQVPHFEPYIEPRNLLEVALEQTDLPSERVLRTEEEAKQYQQEKLMQEMQAQAQAEVEALMAQLQKMGMPPELIQKQLMQILGQTVAEGPQGAAPATAQPQGGAPVPQDVPAAPPTPMGPAVRQLPIQGPENVL